MLQQQYMDMSMGMNMDQYQGQDLTMQPYAYAGQEQLTPEQQAALPQTQLQTQSPEALGSIERPPEALPPANEQTQQIKEENEQMK
jgi:hypothetical protein